MATLNPFGVLPEDEEAAAAGLPAATPPGLDEQFAGELGLQDPVQSEASMVAEEFQPEPAADPLLGTMPAGGPAMAPGADPTLVPPGPTVPPGPVPNPAKPGMGAPDGDGDEPGFDLPVAPPPVASGPMGGSAQGAPGGFQLPTPRPGPPPPIAGPNPMIEGLLNKTRRY